MKNNQPLSPHIQIYSWHVSSLVSISHRITGVVNIILLSLFCLMICSFIVADYSLETAKNFFNSFPGKFIILGFIWSYCFQILSEIRHWFWDLGYGFELKTSKVTGILVIIGSLISTILIYLYFGGL